MIVRANAQANQSRHITPGRDYIVISLNHGSYRVIDDDGVPALYSKSMFETVDSSIPDDWVWERYTEDEYYAHPPELSSKGFFEDWFDGKPTARQMLKDYLEREKGTF